MAEEQDDRFQVGIFVRAFIHRKVFDGMIINVWDSSYEKPIRVSIWETSHVYKMRKQDLEVAPTKVNKAVSQPLDLSMETDTQNKVRFYLSPFPNDI